MNGLIKNIQETYKVGFKCNTLFFVLAIACLVVFISARGGFVSAVNSVAGDFSDKLDTMSIASGGSSQM